MEENVVVAIAVAVNDDEVKSAKWITMHTPRV